MDARLQLRVQRYGWDAAASIYDDSWRGNLAPAQSALVEMIAVEPGHHVVETAAGSGLVTIPLARAVSESGHVTATDISAKMLEVGEDEVAAAGLTNVTFDRQNAEQLSFPSHSFDRAACALGLMYLPNPSAALSEMARVLKPGSRAAVAVWGERRNCGWAEIFPIVDSRVQSDVCPMFFGLGPPGALVGSMERAGFVDIEERRISTTLAFESAEALIEAVIDAGPVALAAKRFDAETRADADAEFLESVAQHKVGDGYAIPGEFVIAAGSTPA